MVEPVIAGIVTFNPNQGRFLKNINAIAKQVSKIVVVDNCSSNIVDIEKWIEPIKFQIILIKNKKNEGIAKALNQIFTFATSNSYNWVITLDQDSIPSFNMVEKLVEVSRVKENIGIVCPQIQDDNCKDIVKTSQGNQIIDRCITSGSLTSVDAWKAIGKFDELMFIDLVDFDFCYRLFHAGYVILKVNSVVMNHEIGHISERKFLMFNVNVKNHSAFRKYYIARNIIYYDAKHHIIGYPLISMLHEIKMLLIVLIYEKDKINKLNSIFCGIRDGFRLSRRLH